MCIFKTHVREQPGREWGVGVGGRAPGQLVPREQPEDCRQPSVVSEALIVFLRAGTTWGKQVTPESSALFPNEVSVAEGRNLFCLQFDFLDC